MSPPAVIAPPPQSSLSVFKEGIFNGKVLFCTGGGSGICKAMTEAVLRHGANATIVGRTLERLTKSAKELSEATGRTVIPAQADVRDPKQVLAAVAKTIERFGRIDFVISGAAGNFIAPIGTLSENAFKSVISIDLLGTYNTVKATLPYIRESRGSYLHVSATLHYVGMPFQAHVSAAKAGIDALSNVIAVEEGPRGIRSNVLAPGAIHGTEGMDRLTPPGETNETMSSKVPLQRLGDKRDIANATVFLFSEAANYITGQILVVDGAERHCRSITFPYPDAVLRDISTKL